MGLIGAAIAGAAVSSAGGMAASAMAKKPGVSGGGQTWADPLGPSGFTKRGKPLFNRATGAIPMRDWIFNDLNKIGDSARNGNMASIRAAKQFAHDPGFKYAADNARQSAHGDFLNGTPQLNAMIAKTRAASSAEGANAAANMRSQLARNGMSFSTVNQQAQAGVSAAARAQADAADAQARMANYTAERQAQINSPAALVAANAAPLDYLRYADAAQLSQLSQISQIIAGLAGGGSNGQADTVVSPGSNIGGAAINGAMPYLQDGVKAAFTPSGIGPGGQYVSVDQGGGAGASFRKA